MFMMNMDWLLQCVIWITLTSAYKCKHSDEVYDYPQYYSRQDSVSLPRTYEAETWKPLPMMRNGDPPDPHQRPASSSERLTQRTNERSIAVSSDIQRVQEEERRRVQSKVEDPTVRTENSTYKIVNNYPKAQTSLVNRRGQLDEHRSSLQDSVIFPGPTSSSSHELIPEIPEECLELGYCENVPNYPTELAERIISQLGEERHRFHVDVLDITPEIVQRYGPAEDNFEMCFSTEKIVLPQSAPDKNGKWYFILNKRDEPLQGYRVEICKYPNNACNKNVASFHEHYKGTCKQKYVSRAMTAIDADGNLKYDMPFKLPSCCSCIVSRVN